MTNNSGVLQLLKRIALFPLIAFSLFLFSGLTYAANDKVYSVAKFKVEARAANAVKAKKKAIAEGRIAAFQYLLRRVTSYSNHSRLPRVTPKMIDGMLDGLSVRNEKNSRVRYIASLDFNFRANDVRGLLRSYSIPIIEAQSDKIVIVPVYYSEETNRASRRIQRAWRKAWLNQDLVHTLTPVQLGHKKAVVSNEAIEALLSGDSKAFKTIRDDYIRSSKAKYFVMALARKSEKDGKMEVMLLGDDAAGPFHLNRNYKIYRNKISWDSNKAANFALHVIEGRWKLIQSEALGDDIASAPQNVLVTVIFSGLREWQQLRGKIAGVPGVDIQEIGSLSARGAEISLSYPGGAERLSRQIGRYSLVLENENGAWIMRGL